VKDVKMGKISRCPSMGRLFSLRWQRLGKTLCTGIADRAKMA
jgi:hypothetical protein